MVLPGQKCSLGEPKVVSGPILYPLETVLVGRADSADNDQTGGEQLKEGKVADLARPLWCLHSTPGLI